MIQGLYIPLGLIPVIRGPGGIQLFQRLPDLLWQMLWLDLDHLPNRTREGCQSRRPARRGALSDMGGGAPA